MLCDTAASQSFVLEGVLPFDNRSYTRGIVFSRPVVVNSPEPVCPDDLISQRCFTPMLLRAQWPKKSAGPLFRNALMMSWSICMIRLLLVSWEEKSNKSAPAAINFFNRRMIPPSRLYLWALCLRKTLSLCPRVISLGMEF